MDVRSISLNLQLFLCFSCNPRCLFTITDLVSGRESFKEVNSLHLPLERYSPVRRASEGCATGLGVQYRSSPQHHLHSHPHPQFTVGDKEANMKALQQEYQQLQQVQWTIVSE